MQIKKQQLELDMEQETSSKLGKEYIKNWCFLTVVLEKTLETPLDCKELQAVHPKGNQSWIFIGRTDAEVETNTLATWCEELTHWKRPWCWERLKAGGEGDDRGCDGWRHHWLNGHEFEQALRVGDGQGSLACCSHGVTNSWTWLSNWIITLKLKACQYRKREDPSS